MSITIDSFIEYLTKLRNEHGNINIVTGEGQEEPSEDGEDERGYTYFDLSDKPIVLNVKADSQHGDYDYAKDGPLKVCVIHL
jgi:hypothetical protein